MFFNTHSYCIPVLLLNLIPLARSDLVERCTGKLQISSERKSPLVLLAGLHTGTSGKGFKHGTLKRISCNHPKSLHPEMTHDVYRWLVGVNKISTLHPTANCRTFILKTPLKDYSGSTQSYRCLCQLQLSSAYTSTEYKITVSLSQYHSN